MSFAFPAWKKEGGGGEKELVGLGELFWIKIVVTYHSTELLLLIFEKKRRLYFKEAETWHSFIVVYIGIQFLR